MNSLVSTQQWQAVSPGHTRAATAFSLSRLASASVANSRLTLARDLDSSRLTFISAKRVLPPAFSHIFSLSAPSTSAHHLA